MSNPSLAFVCAILLAITGAIEHYISSDIHLRLERHEYDSPLLKSILEMGTTAAWYGTVAHGCLAAGMFFCCCCLGQSLSVLITLVDSIATVGVFYECMIEGEMLYALAALFFGIVSTVGALIHSIEAAEALMNLKRADRQFCDPFFIIV